MCTVAISLTLATFSAVVVALHLLLLPLLAVFMSMLFLLLLLYFVINARNKITIKIFSRSAFSHHLSHSLSLSLSLRAACSTSLILIPVLLYFHGKRNEKRPLGNPPGIKKAKISIDYERLVSVSPTSFPFFLWQQEKPIACAMIKRGLLLLRMCCLGPK